MNRLLPLLLCTAAGCAHLGGGPRPAPPPVAGEQVAQWLADGHYGQALDALAAADPRRDDYPELAALRTQVERRAADYERTLITRTRAQAAAGDWADAFARYDEALARLPRSTALRDGLAALHREQQRAAAEREQQLTLERGRFLVASLPQLAAIARIRPRDEEAGRRLEERRQEAAAVAADLAAAGHAALERDDYARAEPLLEVATALAPTSAGRTALERVRQWRQEQHHARRAQEDRRRQARQARQAQQQARAVEQGRQAEALVDAYQAALRVGDLAGAGEWLGRIAREAPHALDLAAEQERLDLVVERHCLYLFEQGVAHYSREEFDTALDLWRQVLALRPDDTQAREHAARAERVLEKIRSLREKQTAARGPP